MSDTKTLNASCLCGAVKHQITLPTDNFPLSMHLCHCTSCRHMVGALALTVVYLPDNYRPSDGLLEKLTPFKFSGRITQYHCSICGSQTLCHAWRDADDHSKGSSWDVSTGTLEKIEGLIEVVEHLHVADTLDGGFADFLTTIDGKSIPRWPHHANQGKEVPLRWSRPDRPTIELKDTERLHAHCKCRGVEFWVARPDERAKEATGKWPDLLIPHWAPSEQAVELKHQLGDPWFLRADGTKYLGGVCACNSCRLDTGFEWIEWAFVPRTSITLDEAGTRPFKLPFGTLKAYSSSGGVTRYHCKDCGASVFYFADDRPEVIDIAAALFDAPEGARAETWLEWECNRLSYREDAIPRAESLTIAVEKGLGNHAEWMYPHQLQGEDK